MDKGPTFYTLAANENVIRINNFIIYCKDLDIITSFLRELNNSNINIIEVSFSKIEELGATEEVFELLLIGGKFEFQKLIIWGGIYV